MVASRTASASSAPSTRRFRPITFRAPPIATSSTSRVSPGSNLTAVPDAMFKRMPYAAARSNARQRLTSGKWKCEPTCTGRSPVFTTSSRRVGRPTLISIGSWASKYSPGIMASPYGLVDGHELRTIRKGALHLDLTDHLADSLHHRLEREDRRPDTRDLGGRPAVADELEQFGRDQRHCLRMIQFQAARASSSGEFAGGENDELVDLAWSQMHGSSLTGHRRSAVRATGRRSCDSRATPRIRAHPGP